MVKQGKRLLVQETPGARRTALTLALIGLLFGAVPYLGHTGIPSVDELLFSPLAVLFALIGFGASVLAISIVWRAQNRSPLTWGAGFLGAMAAVLGIAAIWL